VNARDGEWNEGGERAGGGREGMGEVVRIWNLGGQSAEGRKKGEDSKRKN